MARASSARHIDTLALNGLALPPFFCEPAGYPTEPFGHEADLSTEQGAPQAHTRVPCAHGHPERPPRARAAARQGPAQADTLRTLGSRTPRERRATRP